MYGKCDDGNQGKIKRSGKFWRIFFDPDPLITAPDIATTFSVAREWFGRKDFLPVEPPSSLSFLIRLSEPWFA